MTLHFKDRRGAANRSVTDRGIAPKSPSLCVNRSPILYGFRADAKAILFAIIKWKPWMKVHFLFKTHRSKDIQKDSLYSYRCLELDHWWQTLVQVALSTNSTVGILSNYDDDNFKKTKRLMIKTTALHVHHACSTLLWRPLYDYDVKPPNLTFYGGRGHTTTNFPSSFWTWIKCSRIQL